MRFCKKVMTLLLVVLLLVTAAPAAFAVSDASEEAGKTATLTFQFNDVYSVSGAITIVDPNEIVSGYTVLVSDPGATTASVDGNRVQAVAAAEPIKTNVTVEVQVTTYKRAAAGTSCTVSFSGVYGDANEEPGSQRDVYQSATLTVKEAASAETSTPAESGQSGTTTAPEVTKPQTDYTTLNKQITIANGLDMKNYTTDTGNALKQALSAAKSARKSTSQSKVDAAATTLANSIANLVRLDYSKLQQALADAEDFAASDGLVDQWQELEDAVKVGRALLTSGDQTAVDAATTHISDVLTQIKEDLAALQEPKIVEVEVPVEVLPEGDYCNITVHRAWTVAAVGSLVLNVALIVMIAAYVIKKKKYQNDDTPLVNYDIGDDI